MEEQPMGKSEVRPESSRVPGTILFLSHDSSRTGAPIFLLNLLRWLHRHGRFGFRTLTGRHGELSPEFAALGALDSFEPARTLGYKIMRRLQLQSVYDSPHQARLREALAGDEIALLYVNSIASAGMLDFLSFLQCPVICHVHELEGAIRTIGSEKIAQLEKHRPLYVAVSRAVKANLVQNHGIAPSRIEVIHGFIPTAGMKADNGRLPHDQLPAQLAIPSDAKVVCACGSIDFRKGPDLFLELASKIAETYNAKPVHFIWVGGSPEKVAAMTRQLDGAPMQSHVHFVGQTSDPARYLGASDVFVLTSREDPFPLVVMEAARRGKPIVCFGSAGGAPEFVEEDAGFVVPGLDVQQMSERVVELLSSPSLAHRMGEAASRKVFARHSLEAGAADRIASVIERVLRGDRSAHNDLVLPEEEAPALPLLLGQP
jgi:glycosyltransferase involved in cell wall biosynthesis